MHKCAPANAGKKPFGGMFMNYSYQRQVVLETLRGQKEHLTAQQLYQLARKSCPRLSLGTVYRNLNTLVEIGQAGRVAIPGEADRFDWEMTPHQHFYCHVCQKVRNLDLPTDSLDALLQECPGNVKVESYSFMVTGVCADCQDKA